MHHSLGILSVIVTDRRNMNQGQYRASKSLYFHIREGIHMIRQTTFHLSAKRRGCHLVTQEILEQLPKPLPQVGMLNLFVQHTSCALSINENYDPDVRTDMEAILNHMVKEREPYYEHTMEGSDDMPAHAKCSLFGVSLTIPITNGRLNMGTWQGIYLCEFRNHGGSRKIVATIYE